MLVSEPVGDSPIYSPNRSNPYGLLAGTYLWDQFQSFQLKEIMRQRDDHVFALALNNLASGDLTKEQVELFKVSTE